MPKTTRIIQRRYRRQKRDQRGGHVARRITGILLLVSLTAAAMLIVSSLLVIILSYAYLTQEVPDYDGLVSEWKETDATNYETTKIYANSHLDEPIPIYEIVDPLRGQREWLTLDELPVGLPDATIASEEPGYWTNPTYGIPNILRELFRPADMDAGTQGTNRILQRVVHNYLVDHSPSSQSDSSLARRRQQLRRLLITYRVSQTYSNSEILEWYLNTTFYGNLAYGVEAAARVYFNKSVTGLNLAEAAMLAAIPQAPGVNPIDDPQAAKAGQEQVLTAMAEQGSISREVMAVAQFTPMVSPPGLEQRLDIIAPHFALYVQQELEALFDSQLLLSGGLKVYTTLDLDIQRQAECLSRAHLNRLSGYIGADLPADERSSCIALDFLQSPADEELGIDFQADNAAVIVMEAENAGIKAMVGSLDYWDHEGGSAFNIASDGRRQPGTILKPFIYLTALSQGYTPATMVMDVETPFRTGDATNAFIPQNQDNLFHGPMRLREALGNNYHVPAVQVMGWVGVSKVLRTAHSLGITSLDGAQNRYDLSVALGGGEVTLLDMVYAYNVMNNMGVMLGQPPPDQLRQSSDRPLNPVAILRVEDRAGNLLYEHDSSQRRKILAPQLAYLMNDMMSDRSARCTSFGCPNILELPDNRPVAVFTGSTNDFRDAWTIGYTPQLVTGVWMGNSDNRPMDGLLGINGPAPIWQALMSWIMQDVPVAVWTQPPDLVEIAVCDTSGLLSTPYCPTVSELFIVGTQPTVQDTIYQEYAVNRETNRLATIYTPPELVEHRIFQVYPEAAADWAEANGIVQPPDEYDTIRGPARTQEDAALTWPKPFAFLGDRIIIRGTATGDDFDHYRLAYYAGLTPANMQVIAADVTRPMENGRLAEWDVSNLDGLHTLLLTVFRRDGSFAEASLPVTIDNSPPAVEIIFPRPDQEISISAQQILFQVQASDNLAVSEVAFYLDDATIPFATSNRAPYTAEWQIRGPGCHSFTALARDTAGNETSSSALPLCLVNNQ